MLYSYTMNNCISYATLYSLKLYKIQFKTKWIPTAASGTISTVTIHDVHSLLTHYPYRVSPIIIASYPRLYNHIYGRCNFRVLSLHPGIADWLWPSIYWHKNVLFWL